MRNRTALSLSILALVFSSACKKSEPAPLPVPVIPAVPAAPAPVAPAPVAPAPAAPAAPAAAAAPAGGTTLEVNSSNPNFGTKTLAPGFMPDPDTTAVVSGGNIDVSTLPGIPPGCTGWVTARPDMVLNYGGTSANLRIFVRATQQNGDTTLIINDGSGKWHCNDDVESGNFNPMVDIANAPAGHYDIWIGSYAQGTQVPGTLNVTELQSNRP